MRTTPANSVDLLCKNGPMRSTGRLPLAAGLADYGSTDSTQHVSNHRQAAGFGISSHVRTALTVGSRTYRFADVDVKSRDEAVVLSGYVNTQEQKTQAGDIAKRVRDVKRVVNIIVVRTGS